MRVIKKIFLGICFWAVALFFLPNLSHATSVVTPSSLPSWYGTSESNDTTAGGNTAIGDFNCDGIDDVILAAPAVSSYKGRIYISYGSSSFSGATLLSNSYVDVSILGTTDGDRLGQLAVVNIDGDVDGVTGYECDDIIALGDQASTGFDTIYVFKGSTSGWTTGMDADAEAEVKMYTSSATGGTYDYLHLLGPLDGDINSDGVTNDLDDFLAICSADTNYCFLLPVMNLSDGAVIEDESSYQITGETIYESVISGDIDFDGNEDLIIGDSEQNIDEDTVTIFFGPLASNSSMQNNASLSPSDYFQTNNVNGEDVVIVDNNASKEGFGTSVTSSNIFGTNYSDIIIGSPNDDSGSTTSAGRYHIISGESLKNFRDTHSSSTGFEIYNDTSYGTYNYSDLDVVLIAGDVSDANVGYAYNAFAGADFNGDGRKDLVLGGKDYYATNNFGVAHVIYGGDLDSLVGTETTLNTVSEYYLEGVLPDNKLSTNVIAGDVTGDGLDDLIVTEAGTYSTYLWVGAATDLDGDSLDSNEDCNDRDGSVGAGSTWYADTDADGFGDSSATLESCTQPEGYVSDNTDCDDADASNTEGFTWYRDNDSDGYGSLISTVACTAPANYVDNRTDCDDTNSGVNPDAVEICDGADNDCDAATPEDTYASDTSRWYRDADTDGYGSASVSTTACSAPSGYVGNDSDCNDSSASAYPGNSETAAECEDGIDQNCDGADLACETAGPDDLDADGYVSVSDGGDDCDDTNSSVNPGAAEICDTLDNDCNSSTDEDLVAADTLTWYADEDGDGFGDAENSVTACTQPDDFVENSSDCADNNATVSPEGAEVCGDSVDQNCDGADLACASDEDLDDDGYVSPEDCNDEDATVNPGAAEAGNALDDNCNGQIDEGLSHVTLAEIDETVSQGSRFDVKVNLSNESGFRNFRVVVMVQNKPMSSSAAKKMYSSSNNNLRLVPYFLGNTNCSDEGDCEEIYDISTYINNDGDEESYIFSPTMPSDKDDGKTYFVQVQFRDPETDAIIMQTQTASSFPNFNYKKSKAIPSASLAPTKLSGDESADPFITVE